MLPREFQEAFDESKRQEVVDSLCVLYVAMTRAIHATYIVMSYGCKPVQSSNAAVLLATLHPGDRDEGVVFSLGDPNWHENMKPVAAKQSDSFDEFYLPLDATISTVTLPPENRSGRGIKRIAPSGLEGGDQIEMSSIFATVANSDQMNRGTFLHACFEKIDWLDDEIPSRKVLKEHLASLGPLPEDTGKLLKLFEKQAKNPNTMQLLSRQSYLQDFVPPQLDASKMIFDALRVEVQNERSFAVMADGKLMQGSIDRLILVFEGDKLLAADVIDYKTDEVSDSTLAEKVEHYRPQLFAYQRAVSEFTGLAIEKVTARLLFVSVDKLCDLNAEIKLPKSAPAKAPDSDLVPARKFKKNHQKTLWTDD